MSHATIITEFGVATVGEDHCAVAADGSTLRAWANRPGAAWPCSELAEASEVCASFDTNGLVDLTGVDCIDLSGDELSAWTSDVLRLALAETHPCWFVCVGQFASEA